MAKQLMSKDQVLVGGQTLLVKCIGRGRLRTVQFSLKGKMIEAIEQNPEKSSRWAELARQRHQVVQFIEVETHRYLAVSVDGKAREYANKGKDY